MYARLHFYQISPTARTALSILGFSMGSILEPLGNTLGRFAAVRTFRRSSFFHWSHLGVKKMVVFIKISMTRDTRSVTGGWEHEAAIGTIGVMCREGIILPGLQLSYS